MSPRFNTNYTYGVTPVIPFKPESQSQELSITDLEKCADKRIEFCDWIIKNTHLLLVIRINILVKLS